MNPLLVQLSQSVTTAATIEELTRPLLEMLEAITGLESTYLTTINLKNNSQYILFSRNTGQMCIPEGLTVPWDDTLCKRAIDEGCSFTNEVSQQWADSSAARELGIQTYLSTPVRTGSGELYGTLCAASSTRKEVSGDTDKIVGFFAQLIGQYVERELLLDQLKKANSELVSMALTDSLTGLPNRRALFDELHRMFAHAKRLRQTVLIGFVDLDGFKSVNDTYGHAIGDALLKKIATGLQQVLREGDLVARMGGDEFVAIGFGPLVDEPAAHAASTFESRLFGQTVVSVASGEHHFDYAGASVGVITVDPSVSSANEALNKADLKMYQVKLARKEQKRARIREAAAHRH